jgi:hypothetical protein
MNRISITRRVWLGTATMAMASLSLPLSLAAAEDEPEAEVRLTQIDKAFDELSGTIKRFFKAQGQTEVVLEPFTGKALEINDKGNEVGERDVVEGTSAGLVKRLQDRLTSGDDALTVVPDGALRIAGNFRGMMDRVSDSYCVIVDAAINDVEGRQAHSLTKYIITDEATGLALMGATGELPLASAAGGTSEALQEARAKVAQQFAVQATPAAIAGPAGSILRPAPDSPFGIELLVQGSDGQYRPLAPTAGEFNLGLGDKYAVRIYNDSPDACGVTLTIDGINALAFSRTPSYRGLGKYFVRGGKTALVKGWHDLGPTVHQFEVMTFGDTPAASLGATGGVGAITAVFCAATELGGKLPADEPPAGLVARGDLATGLGPLVDQTVRDVQARFGVPRATVTARYTRPNLEDLPAAE